MFINYKKYCAASPPPIIPDVPEKAMNIKKNTFSKVLEGALRESSAYRQKWESLPCRRLQQDAEASRDPSSDAPIIEKRV